MPTNAFSPSPSSSTTHKPYIVHLTQRQYEAVDEDYKNFLIDNLETVLIGHPSPATWPRDLKAAIADTIIRGRFKYIGDESRTHRTTFNSTLTLGTSTPISPLPRDTDSEKRGAVIHEAVCAALNYLVSENAFVASYDRLNQLRDTAANYNFSIPDAPARLGAIASLIRDVASGSTRHPEDTVDVLLTAITGMPCIVDEDETLGVLCHTREAHGLTNKIIFTVSCHMLEALPPVAAVPGHRWQTAMFRKLDYLHKISSQYGQYVANDEVLRILSKIDLAHAMLETGVALKGAGKKICFVAPYTLTLFVTLAIADIYADETDVKLAYLQPEQSVWYLADQDRSIMEASEPNPKYGQWTSFRASFSRTTLTDFISREGRSWDRVAANSHGDVMFFVEAFGPWMPSNEASIRSETTTEFLQHMVQMHPIDIRGSRRFRRKKGLKPVEREKPIRIHVEPDKKLDHTRFHPCTYESRTLKAIINKPGRVLVRKTTIRGSGGRIAAAGILVLGVVAVVLNIANRDNWLEVAFDGAQVMSLVAGVAVAFVYVVNGTLTSTLDWLGGVTEVSDDEQLAQVLGVMVDAVKVACTYEKGFLFWLSEINSCFCPARRPGTLMFTEPLNIELNTPHVRYSSVIGEDCGLWILQGWAFRIEKDGDVGHMVRVPHEDRVYVNDGKLRKFGGRSSKNINGLQKLSIESAEKFMLCDDL